jgi:soluble lytic murein transglycosylase
MKRAILAMTTITVLVAAAAVITHLTMPGWYARHWYPLDHADLISRSAGQNRLDPALVAAVIYEESGFEDGSQSHAGAVGLMQLMPATATWIAAKTGGVDFAVTDLKDPGVNIAYGCWYLRYLIDLYGSTEVALAAYNGGIENVDQWLADARQENREFSSVVDIPWQETRDYVARVDRSRNIYTRAYTSELGI